MQDNPEYPVAKWAQMLNIERTGYYAWFRKRESHLKKRIKEEFNESRGTYGPDRITAELRKKGEHIGRKRCAEYMAEMHLDSCHNRHRAKSLTNSKKARQKRAFLLIRVQGWKFLAGVPGAAPPCYLRWMAKGPQAWSTGMTSTALMFTWAGRLVHHQTISAMSSAVTGSVPL